MAELKRYADIRTNTDTNMLIKVAAAISSFVAKSFSTPVRWIAGVIGMLWAAVTPVIPFIIPCTIFVFTDCLSAWMLSRRVKKYYPEHSRGCEFRSEYASKIFNTLAIIYLLVIGGYWLDINVFTMFKLYMGNWIAGAFCLVQIVSVLENSSSCNGSTWAIVIQKVLVDKTNRHLKIDLEKMIHEAKQQQEAERHGYEFAHEHYPHHNDTKENTEMPDQVANTPNTSTPVVATTHTYNEDEAKSEEDERRKILYKERARKAAETRRRNAQKAAENTKQ